MKTLLKREALAEHIARRNLSQNRFANTAGISHAYVAQLLAGKRNPSGVVREKLMQATGMDFDDLFQIVPGKERATDA